MLAADHVQPPFGRLAEGDVVDLEALAVGQHEHLRPEAGGQPPLVGLVVAGHELSRPAVDVAGAGDAQAVGAGSGDDAAAGVVLRVGAHQQLGVVGQVEIDAAFQNQRADEIFLAAADEHLRASARRGSLVDGALDSGGIEGGSVADRAVLPDVEDADTLRR